MRAEGMDVVFYADGNRIAVQWHDKYTLPRVGDEVGYRDRVYLVKKIRTCVYMSHKPDVEIHIEEK